MRALDDRELDTVSGGSLLLIAGLVGVNVLGGLLNSVGVGPAAAAGSGQAVGGAGASANAVTPGGAHGFAPATRKPGDVFDGMLQRGAGVVEAGVQDIAGHFSAGVRDAADLIGRLI